MGKPTGFMEFNRHGAGERSAAKRTSDWNEFVVQLGDDRLKQQGARCMNCGVPFCHTGELIGRMTTGCPINNLIPEWNHMIYEGRWEDALVNLHSTNNFPEFTGRVCPAPCEGSCVLGINDDPVTIKNIERTIVDRGFENGWIKPRIPESRTGNRVAVIGSGPSGLAAADMLNQAGHHVTVFERDDRIGGLLMYGIPNMKLDKQVVARRIDLLEQEGICFKTSVDVGVDITPEELRDTFDGILFCVGSTRPRDLKIPGRTLSGIHFAMEYLRGSTQSLLNESDPPINVKGKRVIVIGGGDTGTDCIGTAIRQGCSSLVNLEIVPRPPKERSADNPWPQWPIVFRTDYGHAEAAEHFGSDPRQFAIESLEFVGDTDWNLIGLRTCSVDWSIERPGVAPFSRVEGSEQTIHADFVFLALGFVGPQPELVERFGLQIDQRGNVSANDRDFETSIPGVFAAGDCRRGQSLVVWAIKEGRNAAAACDSYLKTRSHSRI
ncbi:MAG: glutamate synthase subunit beta [Planctomycetota bacterium]